MNTKRKVAIATSAGLLNSGVARGLGLYRRAAQQCPARRAVVWGGYVLLEGNIPNYVNAGQRAQIGYSKEGLYAVTNRERSVQRAICQLRLGLLGGGFRRIGLSKMRSKKAGRVSRVWLEGKEARGRSIRTSLAFQQVSAFGR